MNITSDRIVEIALIKFHSNGKEERFTHSVNPIIEITKEVILIYGITNDIVLNEHTFKEIAPKIRDLNKETLNFVNATPLLNFAQNRFEVMALRIALLYYDYTRATQSIRFFCVNTYQ